MANRRFATISLALIAAFSLAAPAAAIVPPVEGGNPFFPGRPLRDDGVGSSNCRVSAYGRVDGDMVIFLPKHCDAWGKQQNPVRDQPGMPAYTNNGVRVGSWGTAIADVSNNDLTYIVLDSGWIPSVASGLRNKIYRGNVAGSDYWTMTSQPTAADGCGGALGNTTIHENWQRYFSSTTPYDTGNANMGKIPINDGCEYWTNMDWHTGVCCTSGTPIVFSRDLTTLTAVSTACWDNFTGQKGCAPGIATGRLIVTSFYEGLQDLDAYWDGHGSFLGAKLCTDADC